MIENTFDPSYAVIDPATHPNKAHMQELGNLREAAQLACRTLGTEEHAGAISALRHVLARGMN
jgi:hypothetical protein